MALIFAIGLNIFVLLFYLRGLRTTALVLAVAIAILVIPYNTLLLQRVSALNEERDHVVAYINQVKADTGAYPDDLYGYKYQNWALYDFFRIYTPLRYPTLEEPFGVSYCPVAKAECTFGYWYSPKYGWTYSDD